ncbi:MAG: hypothetical protein IJT12_09180 [Paludibacteraceae bacterium]|nr:hypothetical protein [Paludibacteraceae bacterium]
MEKKTGLPRGYRNNNPLNIRRTQYAHLWKGVKPLREHTDKEFLQFKEMAYGFRAAFCVLRTYIGDYKLKTIDAILRRWAPENENDTEGYIRLVAHLTRLDVHYPLDWDYKAHMVPLVRAMATVENGIAPVVYEQDIEEGWRLFMEDKAGMVPSDESGSRWEGGAK